MSIKLSQIQTNNIDKNRIFTQVYVTNPHNNESDINIKIGAIRYIIEIDINIDNNNTTKNFILEKTSLMDVEDNAMTYPCYIKNISDNKESEYFECGKSEFLTKNLDKYMKILEYLWKLN